VCSRRTNCTPSAALAVRRERRASFNRRDSTRLDRHPGCVELAGPAVRGSRCSPRPPSVRVRRTRSSIDVAAMADLEDSNNEILVVNFVQNAALPLSDSKQIVTRELLATRGPWLTREPLHSRYHGAKATQTPSGSDRLAGGPPPSRHNLPFSDAGPTLARPCGSDAGLLEPGAVDTAVALGPCRP
jgi:hypothetical protein